MADSPSIRELKKAASVLRQAATAIAELNRVLVSAMLGHVGSRYLRHAEIVDQIIAAAASAKTSRAFEPLLRELEHLSESYTTSPLEDANAELKSRAIAQIVTLTARADNHLSACDFEEEMTAIDDEDA